MSFVPWVIYNLDVTYSSGNTHEVLSCRQGHCPSGCGGFHICLDLVLWCIMFFHLYGICVGCQFLGWKKLYRCIPASFDQFMYFWPEDSCWHVVHPIVEAEERGFAPLSPCVVDLGLGLVSHCYIILRWLSKQPLATANYAFFGSEGALRHSRFRFSVLPLAEPWQR